MANISSADGKIIFTKEFWERHLTDIEAFCQNYESAYYGVSHMEIDSDLVDGVETQVLKFYGDGRWSFINCIEGFGGFPLTHGDPDRAQYKVNDDFFALMALENESLIMEYSDYEPGCDVCYEAKYRITPTVDSGTKELGFRYEEIYVSDLETDDASLINNGFEDGSFANQLLADKDPEYMSAAEEAGLTPESFTEALNNMPNYKGGIKSYRLDEGWDDVISDVKEYIEGLNQSRT